MTDRNVEFIEKMQFYLVERELLGVEDFEIGVYDTPTKHAYQALCQREGHDDDSLIDPNFLSPDWLITLLEGYVTPDLENIQDQMVEEELGGGEEEPPPSPPAPPPPENNGGGGGEQPVETPPSENNGGGQ